MSVRDKLITGELDAAHCLWSLPFSVATGVTQPKGEKLPIAMTMSANGQGITLANESFPIACGDLQALNVAIELCRARKGEPLTFASTFAGGTHDIWLRTVLDAAGVSPDDYQIVTVPPAQMVLNLRMGQIDGYSAGEPWNAVAAETGAGWTFMASQDIWPNHPEKALVCHPAFVEEKRDKLKALMKALLEACLWLDNPKNLDRAAQKLAKPEYVGTAYELIKGRLMGHYNMGGEAGTKEYECKVAFSQGGTLNAPQPSYGVWFIEQMARLGFVMEENDPEALSSSLILSELYAEVIAEMQEAGIEIASPFPAESPRLAIAEAVA